MFVGVVIVTFRRPDTVARTLDAVLAQSRLPDGVVVVDNGHDEGLRELLEGRSPLVEVLLMSENLGFAAGLARGLGHLVTNGATVVWLLDDDSPPDLHDLENALAVASSVANERFLVGTRGGHLPFGVIRHDLENVSEVQEADFLLVDGALLSAAAVQAAGMPRSDFFMMHEDLEYSTRVRAVGGTLLVRPSRPTALHLGSDAAWRSYYQARNHLRIAIDRRSPKWAFGWLWRMGGFVLTDLSRRRWRRLLFRVRGTYDAARGRMGRTLDPATFSKGSTEAK